MTARRSAAVLAPLALAAALLAGCGEEGSQVAGDPDRSAGEATSEASTPTPSGSEEQQGPACTEVWRDGATLPGGYDGCDDGGTWVPADGRYCEFGKPLVTHELFYAVPGGRIAEAAGDLLRDRGYRDVLRKCSG